LEFYVNFGIFGVVVGMFGLGSLFRLIDTAAGKRFAEGDLFSFARWFVVGASMLRFEGSFVELTSSAAGALVFCALIAGLRRRRRIVTRI
jgi:hypothetical protein